MGSIFFFLLVVIPVGLLARAYFLTRKERKENPYIKEHKKRQGNRAKYIEYLRHLAENSPDEIPLPEVMDEEELERRILSREQNQILKRLFK